MKYVAILHAKYCVFCILWHVNAEAQRTIGHIVIKKWAEERGGKPAVITNTSGNGDGILRIDFPGYSEGENLKHISWETFFRIFEENELAFLYQERMSDGSESRFYKFNER